MIFPTAFAQETELLIKENLAPIGPLTTEPLSAKIILATVVVLVAVAAVFLFTFPKIASRALGLNSFLVLSTAAVLGVLLPFTLYALSTSTTILLKAAPGSIPENVEILDVAAESFSVSWQTKDRAVGLIRYGTNPKDLEFFAIDIKGAAPTSDHLVKVENLEPNNNYYFEIVSGNLRFNDSEKPLSVKTLP